MKNITFYLFALCCLAFSWQGNAQYGCDSAIELTGGYTANNITTPGDGGEEDWNDNPSESSIDESYWDDDVYLFEYTSGSTAEDISMTIYTRNSWNGIGIFTDCTGVMFSGELDAQGSSSSSEIEQTVSATIGSGTTVYIAVGQWGAPNDLDFDVVSFSAVQNLCPEPSAMEVADVTLNAANLSWMVGGAETDWNLEWGAGEFDPGTGAEEDSATVTGTPEHSLSGLTEGTEYFVYYQADCGGGDTSEWVSFTFTTAYPEPDCATNPTPADAAVDVSVGTVTFSWDAPTTGPTPTSYNMYYTLTPEDPESWELVGDFTETTADLTLTGYETTFYWMIEPVNGDVEAIGCAEWSFTTIVAPEGAACETATEVTEGSYTGEEIPDAVPDANNDSLWLYYVATADGTVTVSSCLGGDDTTFYVFDACGAEEGIAYGSDDCLMEEGGTNSWASEAEFAVTEGTIYYIQWVDQYSNGPFDWSLTLDPCVNATVEYNMVSDCENGEQFFIDVDITDMGTATTIDIMDDQESTPQTATEAGVYQFGPYANGTEVEITIGGDADCTEDSSGVLTQVACPPANDDCENAETLVQETEIPDAESATPTPGTIEGATDSGLAAETCNGWTGTANDDVWYTFEAQTENVNITATQVETSVDLVIQVYSGSCGELTSIGCSDQGVVEQAELTGLTVGESYSFRIYQYGTSATTDKDITVKLWSPDESMSVNDFNKAQFTYYPNPVNNTLTLKAQESIEAVSVYNMLGQEVLRTAPKTVNSELDMSNLANGAYFVKVTVNGATDTVRIIKN